MKMMNNKTKYDVYSIPYAIIEIKKEIIDLEIELKSKKEFLKKLIKKEEQFNKRILRKI